MEDLLKEEANIEKIRAEREKTVQYAIKICPMKNSYWLKIKRYVVQNILN